MKTETENVFYKCVAHALGKERLSEMEETVAFKTRVDAIRKAEAIDAGLLISLPCPYTGSLQRAVWVCVVADKRNKNLTLH